MMSSENENQELGGQGRADSNSPLPLTVQNATQHQRAHILGPADSPKQTHSSHRKQPSRSHCRLRHWGTDLEVEDDGPDQAQRQLGVPIGDVIISDVHQLDLLRTGGWPLAHDSWRCAGLTAGNA